MIQLQRKEGVSILHRKHFLAQWVKQDVYSIHKLDYNYNDFTAAEVLLTTSTSMLKGSKVLGQRAAIIIGELMNYISIFTKEVGVSGYTWASLLGKAAINAGAGPESN